MAVSPELTSIQTAFEAVYIDGVPDLSFAYADTKMRIAFTRACIKPMLGHVPYESVLEAEVTAKVHDIIVQGVAKHMDAVEERFVEDGDIDWAEHELHRILADCNGCIAKDVQYAPNKPYVFSAATQSIVFGARVQFAWGRLSFARHHMCDNTE